MCHEQAFEKIMDWRCAKKLTVRNFIQCDDLTLVPAIVSRVQYRG